MTDWLEFEHEPTDPKWDDLSRRTMQLWGITNGTERQVTLYEEIVKWTKTIGTVCFAVTGALLLVMTLVAAVALIAVILTM